MPTTEPECLIALQKAAEQLGESPTKAQYEGLDIQPSAATILRVVGGWNTAKERAGLATNPSSGTRVQSKPDDVSLPADATWEDLSQDQRWHYRHVDRNTRRTLQRRARRRRWLYERKRDSDGCGRCDETDPACLDYHHHDPGEKTMAVNEMVLYGYSKEKIRSEIEQCTLLCANCHRREHATTSRAGSSTDVEDGETVYSGEEPETRSERRAWSRQYRARHGCRECDLTDSRCLVFHHAESVDKDGGVGAMISDGCAFTTIREEVAKCTVLCANCHRKAHYDVPAAACGNDSV